ncbi:MAG: ABC transporter permease [Hyphomonadaceae bacterium]|nr:ABC transporter permease [Hyphomonadaceae bacterium]
MSLAADYGAVFTRWNTWALMANQDISMRYRRSFLGPFWLSIALGSLVLGIGLLFAEVQRQPFRDFLTFFGCGMLAWTYLQTVTSEACSCVIDNEDNLRNLPLPVPLLSARVAYRNLVMFAHNAVIIGVMIALLGKPLTLLSLWSLVGLALYLPFALFLGAVLGPICARFRDVPQVIATIMQLMFFLTPILWVPHEAMSRPIIYEANPFYHLLEVVRAPMLGQMPTDMNWIVSVSTVAILGVLAVIVTALTRKQIFLWL